MQNVVGLALVPFCFDNFRTEHFTRDRDSLNVEQCFQNHFDNVPGMHIGKYAKQLDSVCCSQLHVNI